MLLTPEKASEFYAEHQGKIFFSTLVTFMSSGPVVAAVLAKADAVAAWRALIGPTNSDKARAEAPQRCRSGPAGGRVWPCHADAAGWGRGQ